MHLFPRRSLNLKQDETSSLAEMSANSELMLSRKRRRQLSQQHLQTQLHPQPGKFSIDEDIDTTTSSTTTTTTPYTAATTFEDTNHVHFCELVTVYPSTTRWCKEDYQQGQCCWYTNEDIQAFKAARKYKARRLQSMEHQFRFDPCSYTGVLESMYNTFCGISRIPPSQRAILQTDKEDNQDYSEDDEEYEQDLLLGLYSNKKDNNDKDEPKDGMILEEFNWWISHTALSRLGLETTICTRIETDKHARRVELLRVVSNLQLPTNPLSLSQEQQALAIRRACRTLSRPSRLFATQLARALHQEPDED